MLGFLPCQPMNSWPGLLEETLRLLCRDEAVDHMEEVCGAETASGGWKLVLWTGRIEQ